MKYTKEQKQKILKYIVKKAKEKGGYSESLHQTSINGDVKTIYEITYGPKDDSACVRLISDTIQDELSLYTIVKNYKKFKSVVLLNNWDIIWSSENEDDVLDCLEALVKAEFDMSLVQFIDAAQKELGKQKQTRQELFFKEN